ncbi:hypothetical protein [Leptospira wolffii]|uniref:hypothetical protein n=1 Tax=Leptospira wolffii TaxID=409998 RepID=UPI0003032210|nr:hypothetical protein [Leptospira wolffii]EPG67506.1 hypothetical protein LEP1GSC061_0971 [Leptospira wolffii serovar Khorat str. Khorat-H2]
MGKEFGALASIIGKDAAQGYLAELELLDSTLTYAGFFLYMYSHMYCRGDKGPSL